MEALGVRDGEGRSGDVDDLCMLADLGVPGLRGTTWFAPRGTFGYFNVETGEASVTGESRLFSSRIGGVWSSSDILPLSSSSKDVYEASESRLLVRDGRLWLDVERLEESRSLSERRNVAAGGVGVAIAWDDGRAALSADSLLEVRVGTVLTEA